jgi:iron complex transport system substrate-binding protein
VIKKKMKTKNKVVTLVEIAIVLCLVFLVALPAIAAEQNQGMQKVTATAREITTSSEDDYVLGVYGNANEDDTIDMGDVVYTKLAIFGKKPKTELCDAKYDGRINVLDVIQTKLIILGKEKEITFLDCGYGSRPRPPKVVTVDKPVERCVVVSHAGIAETFRALNSKDKIVGTNKMIKDNVFFYPEISKLPSVGSWRNLDYEAILNLNPDLILTFTPWGTEEMEKLPGVPVANLCLRFLGMHYTDGVRKLGYILDKEEEAEEYANWYDGWTNKIESQTEELSDDEKPRVFITGPGMGASKGQYTTVCKDTRFDQMCAMAGGKSISEDLTGGWWLKVDTEWVMVQNPDIIVLWIGSYHGYDTDDPSELAASREDIMNRPELANVNAVKTGKVYVSAFGKTYFTHGPGCLIGSAYYAKWFHPELFEDLDPEAMHQEYLTRFQGLDYALDKKGVFVYPPLES